MSPLSPPTLSAYDTAFFPTIANNGGKLKLLSRSGPKTIGEQRNDYLFVRFWGDVLLNKTKFGSANS